MTLKPLLHTTYEFYFFKKESSIQCLLKRLARKSLITNTLIVCARVLLSPPLACERLDQRLNVPVTDGVAKEGHPKFNPRPGRGLNPGPPGWQSEILPTVATSHTQLGYLLSGIFLLDVSTNTELSFLF